MPTYGTTTKTFELTGFTNNNYWIITTEEKPEVRKYRADWKNKRITDKHMKRKK
ncbi:hypothetical protein ACVPOR_15750 [Staphylococcus aureus]